MIACGATLSEILAWERGEDFPMWFKAKVLAYHELSLHKASHIQDAATPRK